MSKLRLKEYLDEAPEPGSTNRVNHANCPAGTDTRGRLYLTVNESAPDMMLGYCHNCQSGGAIKLNKGRRINLPGSKLWTKPFTKSEVPDNYEMPNELSYDLAYMPVDAQVYVRQFPELVREYVAFAYSPHNHSIITPIYEDNYYHSLKNIFRREGYLGYQERSLTGRGPKYRKVATKDRPIISEYWEDGNISKSGFTHVIVEDQISAATVAASGHSGMCIYGCHVSPEFLHERFALWSDDVVSKVAIWLDNDNHYVNERARMLQRYVELMGYRCSLISELNDPKHHTIETISKILKGL